MQEVTAEKGKDADIDRLLVIPEPGVHRRQCFFAAIPHGDRYADRDEHRPDHEQREYRVHDDFLTVQQIGVFDDRASREQRATSAANETSTMKKLAAKRVIGPTLVQILEYS